MTDLVVILIYTAFILTVFLTWSDMRIKQWIAITLFLLIFPLGLVHANDELDSPVETEVSFWDDFLWDASIDVGADFNQEIIETYDKNQFGILVAVNFSLEYKRFYLEAQRSTLPGGSIIGYHLWQNDLWQVDIIGANYVQGFDENGTNYSFSESDYEPLLAGITPRDDDFNVGLKFSRAFEQFDFSSEWVHDLGGAHQSWMVRNTLIKSFSGGNWDLLGGVGVDLYSSKMANYYYGVSDDEANELRTAYQPGLSGSLFSQFTAEYPISENWIYHSAASIGVVTGNIQNSPIVSSHPRIVIYMGVRYVF